MSKVTNLESRQPVTFAGVSQRVEAAIERAYWEFDARKKGYPRHSLKQSERDAFKDALRDMFAWLRDGHK